MRFSDNLNFRNGPDRASWNPKDDFQLFLTTGLFVLIIVRVLAFRLWLRSVEELMQIEHRNGLEDDVTGRAWSGQGFPPAKTRGSHAVTKKC
jgi:hypothetical protein